MGRSALRRIGPGEVPEARDRAYDPRAEERAAEIVDDVRNGGEAALRRWAERLGEIAPGDPLYLDGAILGKARDSLDPGRRALLERSFERVLAFARAQRACLLDLDLPVPGGRAGHRFLPVERAGCYVPGGGFPLASSAIMTAGAAKAAGVASIWCAGPRPAPETLAAAAIAGAEGFLAAGGAQAVAALAFGSGPVAPRDVVVGPGGRYVAAAKRLLFGAIGTEAPAGPSELLVVADGSADPELVAADLLAQAEHDASAVPALVLVGPGGGALADAVDAALDRRVGELPGPNAANARSALGNGFACLAGSLEEAVDAADRFAPEHLELLVEDPALLADRIKNAGAVFVGAGSAEVLGDYGAGPNHCLPTGGAARFAAGLSVLAFLRARTWLSMDAPGELAADAAAFARIEGLEAHARSAELRAGAGASGRTGRAAPDVAAGGPDPSFRSSSSPST